MFHEFEMGRIKVVLLSLFRNKQRNIFLFLVMVVLLSFTILCYEIDIAARDATKIVLRNVPNRIVIQGIFNDNNNLLNTSYNNGDYYKETTAIRNLCEELKEDDRISYIGYQLKKTLTKGTVGKDSFSGGSEQFIEDITRSFYTMTANEFFHNKNNINHINEFFSLNHLYDIKTLVGENYTQPIEVKQGTIELSKEIRNNRFFSQEELDNGEFVCLVNEFTNYDDRYYGLVHFDIGSKIYFSDFYIKDEEVLYVNIYSFTIIGKFVKTKKIDTDYIIVPNNTLIRIQEQQKELMEEYNCDFITSEWLEKNEMFDPNNPKEGFNNISKILYIGSPIIEVTDSEAFSDIVDEIRDRLKDFESIRIITSTEEFDRIVTPLYALKRTDSILCVISTIITLSIVSLILYFQIKDRTREIDVFLALGETKNTIALKIISEFVILGLVALSFSIILCSVIGEYISQYIISKNIIKTTSSELLNMTTRDVIKNFKVFLDVKSVLFISFITIVLIIITSFIGMARIKRISVKSII